MKQRQNTSEPILLSTVLLVCAANLVVLFYQSLENHFNAFFFFLVCAAVRLAPFFFPQFKLKRRYEISLFIIALIIILTSIIGKDILATLFTLLVCLQSLTILRLFSTRELKTCVWVLLFLVAANLLFFFEFQNVVILFMAVIVALSALINHFCNYNIYKEAVSRMINIALLALPVAVILFLVMPRLPPLWKMPKVESQSRGLQDKIRFGDIAELSQSSNLAFRASFDGQPPKTSQMYWRSFVLQNFDGNIWQRSEYMESWQKLVKTRRSGVQWKNLQAPAVNYQVITEASYQNWLFALDLATSRQQGVISLPDFSLYSSETLTQKFRYQVTSYPESQLTDFDNNQIKQLNLQLPNVANPKTEQWVKALKQQSTTDAELIQAVLNYFNQQDFYYSLKPEVLESPKIDDFLFNTRTGFCEHYAGTFTYIMRLAGIPARVVVGYLGGEYNPAGDYFSVYQFDAHAWAEIWQADKGWVRIDPTSYVAPERVEFNLQQAIGNDEFLAERDFSLFKYDQFAAIRTMRMLISNLDYQWTLWVLNYDATKQKDLLKKLFGETSGLAFTLKLAFLILGLFSFIFVVGWLLAHKKSPQSQLQRLQQKATQKLAKKYQIQRRQGQTLRQLKRQTQQHSEALAQNWQTFCQHFEQLEYAPLSQAQFKIHYRACQQLIKQL